MLSHGLVIGMPGSHPSTSSSTSTPTSTPPPYATANSGGAQSKCLSFQPWCFFLWRAAFCPSSASVQSCLQLSFLLVICRESSTFIWPPGPPSGCLGCCSHEWQPDSPLALSLRLDCIPGISIPLYKKLPSPSMQVNRHHTSDCTVYVLVQERVAYYDQRLRRNQYSPRCKASRGRDSYAVPVYKLLCIWNKPVLSWLHMSTVVTPNQVVPPVLYRRSLFCLTSYFSPIPLCTGRALQLTFSHSFCLALC